MIGDKVPKSKSAEQTALPNGTSLILLNPYFCDWNYNELQIWNKNQ